MVCVLLTKNSQIYEQKDKYSIKSRINEILKEEKNNEYLCYFTSIIIHQLLTKHFKHK